MKEVQLKLEDISVLKQFKTYLLHTRTQYAEIKKATKEKWKSGNKSEGNKIVYLTNKRLRNKAGQEVKAEESEA